LLYTASEEKEVVTVDESH